MNKAKSMKWALVGLALAALSATAAASAQAAPQWEIATRSNSAVAPGDRFVFGVVTVNLGDATAIGTLRVTVKLPEGITGVSTSSGDTPNDVPWSCVGNGPGAAPKVLGASVLTCTMFNEFAAGETNNAEGKFGSTELRIEAQAAALAEGSVRVARFELHAPEGSTLPDGTPCGTAPPALACDATVDPVRIDSSSHFGFEGFDMGLETASGDPETKAGIHPYAQVTSFDLQSEHTENIERVGYNDDEVWPVEEARDVIAELPPGLVGNPTSIPTCELAELSEVNGGRDLCPTAAQVGVARVRINGAFGAKRGGLLVNPVSNMPPAPGYAATLGFNVANTVVLIDVGLEKGGDYRLIAGSRNIVQGLAVTGTDLTIWGVTPGGQAFLRSPTSCEGPLSSGAHTDSWKNLGSFRGDGFPDLSDAAWDSASSQSHELPDFPALPSEWGAPVGISECDKVPVKASLSAVPTAQDAETPTGLTVRAEVPNQGLGNPSGVSSSDIKGVRVQFPRGMTINPSQAEGLGTCSSSQYASTELTFYPNEKGCPSDSKVGTVEVKTPLLEETIPGQVFVATPYDNPFDSLLAIYVVLEEPQRGILVKLPGEVKTDGTDGRIEAIFSDLPQTPFSSFVFKFREGARAPLVTPPTCGTYETVAQFTPWSDPNRRLESRSSFTIDSGIGGGPCPPAGTPGFDPGFSAGTLNNAAGAFSPTFMRLTRKDGEQDLTKFSAVLPEGLLAKLAGVARCSDAAIAGASARSGKEELASPSCPASSRIGRTEAGAGVGSVLTYVPGSLYLAGPYRGAPLSVVAITPAVAGPFDVGTVVVRVALDLDPVTGVASVDGSASDPIPHILAGIPLKLRDLRVYVDRSDFTLNPTSCDPMQLEATLWGSAADVFSSADDRPVDRTSRFQAASCGSLGFKPRLGLKLTGGTERGSFPGLQATYRPREGDANAEGLVVRLPRSAFLEQGHIRTICTRVQFASGSCPKGSVYGHIKGWTPLLDEPLSGPVYLRSSNHNLPDLVFDLHGIVDIEVATRIDSVKGGIRAQVEDIPDAPISKVLLRMQGARKGLIVNSRNLCFEPNRNRANAAFNGQNGKRSVAKPVLQPTGCGKARNKRHRRHHGR